MQTFEGIVTGQTRCHKVFEDEHHIAFLSRTPIAPGHTIVIPKRVVPYIFDMDSAAYRDLWECARHTAHHLRSAFRCERVCVAVIGWEVRHAHIHLVPTQRAGEFPGLPGKEASDAELDLVLRRLSGPV